MILQNCRIKWFDCVQCLQVRTINNPLYSTQRFCLLENKINQLPRNISCYITMYTYICIPTIIPRYIATKFLLYEMFWKNMNTNTTRIIKALMQCFFNHNENVIRIIIIFLILHFNHIKCKPKICKMMKYELEEIVYTLKRA